MGDYNFQKLTPIDNAKLTIYQDALDFVFKQEDLKNIAISGAYSAGKSSVLESYKKTQPNIRFLHISLAHFETPDMDDSKVEPLLSHDNVEYISQDSPIITESVLEGKILNQLIHQIDPKRIPQTNFRIKQKVSVLRITVDAALAILFVALILLLLFSTQWNNFVATITVKWINSIFSLTANNIAMIFEGILAALLSGLFLFRVISLQKNKSVFKKISIQGNDIEILGEHKDSYFDRYLNEVLYLFENSDKDVIVFEDMDRFNANQIFERLREVNTLVNIHQKQQYDRRIKSPFYRRFRKSTPPFSPLRFFYLLRDDIFTTKDRTKFFDMIIPVVPVVDGSNSYNKFIDLLKKGNIFNKFDEHFLQKLSLYVDDMRLLRNIYNEFLIYNTRINSTEQDWNKMLAMVTYKNLFPRDFSELQLGKGFIFTMFEQKPRFIADRLKRLKASVKEKEELCETIEREHLLSSTEAHDLLALAQLNHSGYTYNVNAVRSAQLNNSYSEAYDKRNKIIESKFNNSLATLKDEIIKLENEINSLQSLNLSAILRKSNSEEIFMVKSQNAIKDETDFNNIKKSDYFDLLKFLLRNGYLDETYPDYMTYFYENSLSREDKTFLRSIFDRKNQKNFDYQLKDPAKILKYLSLSDFGQHEILNFYLMYYLLETPDKKEYLDAFFHFVITEEDYHYVQEVLLWNTDSYRLKLFINKINSVWYSLLHNIFSGIEFNKNALNEFVILTLYYTPDVDIITVNIEECLRNYIQENPQFLAFGQSSEGIRSNSPNVEMLTGRFELLGVKFQTLEYEISDKNLFRAVYQNNQYELNEVNIFLMLKTMYKIGETKDFLHKNLTLIMTYPESPLSQYIWANIDDYISVLLSFCDDRIEDSEDVALSVINSKDGYIDYINEYLLRLKTKIKNLNSVTYNGFWALLIVKDIVQYSVTNVLDYYSYCKKEISNELVNFINSHDSSVSFACANEFNNKLADSFFDSVMCCNSISNAHYAEILKTINLPYSSDFEFSGISEDKINILINLNFLPMEVESFKFVRLNYPRNLMYYIKKNIEDYIQLMNKELFELNEALHVLQLDIDDSYKKKLIEYTNEPLTVIGKDYSIDVKAFILTRNFDQNDLEFIIKRYPYEEEKVMLAILTIAIDNKETIIDNRYPLPIELFNDLIVSPNITREDKMILLTLVIENLNEYECRVYLKQMGLNKFDSLFEKKRPLFEATEANERLLEAFKKKQWILNYGEDDKKTGYYRAYGRKQQESIVPEFLD